jgi:geranylgeranyl transferase type-2 subunit alpha
MHGRLKVRTSEEQAERKRLEREKKLQMYKHAMTECQKRISAKEHDQIGMKISEDLLSSNGDLQTLWNYRKNTILAYENDDQFDQDQMTKLYLNELSLTEICLKKNPKSYGTWYHRQWCLLRANKMGLAQKNPLLGWENELKLCDLFLNADERNFHCWKHRYFVIENGQLSKLSELEFTYEKICSNFSNYSSWHYRSKLIEQLYYEDQISQEIFKKELELIENAIFTDPNDQSAWIYEKWFLIEHQRSFVKELKVDLDERLIRFKLAKEINLAKDLKQLRINNLVLDFKPEFEKVEEVWHARLVTACSDFSCMKSSYHVRVELLIRNAEFCCSNEFLLQRLNADANIFEFKSKFQVKDIRLDNQMIEQHLSNIFELSKLENEKSKWCLLTAIELMCLMNFSKHKEVIFDYLDRLANEIDVYRKHFYTDLRKKIENKFVYL